MLFASHALRSWPISSKPSNCLLPVICNPTFLIVWLYWALLSIKTALIPLDSNFRKMSFNVHSTKNNLKKIIIQYHHSTQSKIIYQYVKHYYSIEVMMHDDDDDTDDDDNVHVLML
jgi:hypothetical protein